MSRVLTGDTLVESVRNRAMLPEDTSVYTDSNILAIANEEMDVQLLDKLLSLHEEHLTVHVDIPKNSNGIYDIPYRAIGNKIRDVVMITGETQYELTQISIGELPDYIFDTASFSEGLDKFYVESNQIKILNKSRNYDTIRIYFYIRPNVLTKLSECSVITDTETDIENNTYTIQTTKFPAKFENEKLSTFDIVGFRTPNKIKGWDLNKIGELDVENNKITFAYSDVKDFIEEIKMGDYLCKSEESPVPNIPTEMHPLLSQLTAVHILEALGDSEGLANAERRLQKLNAAVMSLVDDRVELAPKKIKPRNSVLSESIMGKVNRRRGR